MSATPHPPEVQAFYTAYDAMCDGDIARLEELTDLSPFPCCTDGWLTRHWLTHAISSGSLASVEWVLSKKPEINYQDDEGFGALKSTLQIEQDHTPGIKDRTVHTLAILQMLVKAGADVNWCGTLDETPLHVAAAWSSPEVVEFLLKHGADPTARDSDYSLETPMDVARRRGRTDILRLLQDAADRTD